MARKAAPPVKKKFDLVVYGATGFTGRLVAEYLHQRYGKDAAPGTRSEAIGWAMAGRSEAKLAQVRDLVGAPTTLPCLAADAQDPAALRRLCESTHAVITTVGPYQLHGEALLQACVDTGTDYLDLCGEPNWMARMIKKHQATAQASGARILFSCGFDSVPFDLGVRFLQHHAQLRDGQALQQVHGRVMVMKGGFSGGTAASLVATMADVSRDPQTAQVMADPFALVPNFKGPPQPESKAATFDEFNQSWSAPFVMAPINTKNVHRTNALLNHLYGRDFVYDERQSFGPGTAGELRAGGMARQDKLTNTFLGFAPTRALIQRFALPKPGTGPSQYERDNGRYEVQFSGVGKNGKTLVATVKGDRDPGYGSTSKIIAECALCLVQEVDRRTTPGGLWTPGAALGMKAVTRLHERAGLSFQIED
jgi:short subunit dehydrogenase-like uncharacterized protein